MLDCRRIVRANWVISNITTSGVLTQNGKIATLYLDTNYVAYGIYALRVLGHPFGPSVYSNAVVLGEPFAGSDGSVYIDPEPSSLVMAGCGLLAMLALDRRRRARRAIPTL